MLELTPISRRRHWECDHSGGLTRLGLPGSRTVTVAVIPALRVTPLGTSSIAIRTGMRWASLTQLNVGLTLAISSLPTTVSGSVSACAMAWAGPAHSVWDPHRLVDDVVAHI